MQLVTKPLAEQVRDVLRERIVGGMIPPNERVDMEALASEFGISVTPVRDAVRLLERDGLVVVRPRKGVFTAQADVKAFRDVFDARIALECLAVETAVERIPARTLDEAEASHRAAAARLLRAPRAEAAILGPIDSAVHDLIVRHCDNDVVKELMEGLRSRTAWVRRMTADHGGRYRQSFVEHGQLLAALQARDRSSAAALLREHLTRSRDHTLEVMAGGMLRP
jgi:DNA-binding GntR family transcriptional regulator